MFRSETNGEEDRKRNIKNMDTQKEAKTRTLVNPRDHEWEIEKQSDIMNRKRALIVTSNENHQIMHLFNIIEIFNK